MNIGITALGCDGGRSGIGQYAVQLLRQFAANAREQFELYVCAAERGVFAPDGAVRAIELGDHLRRPLASIAWHQWSLARWCRRRHHDVLFLPAGNRRLPWRAPCPTVGTVHDLSSLHVAGKYDWARTSYIRQVLPRLVRRLTRVLTVSESSRRDIAHYCRIPEERIHVTPLAVDHGRFFPRDREQAREELQRDLGIDGPYVLYISRLEHPGKNHVRLIRAFEQLCERHDLPHQLVLAGADWTRAAEIHAAAAASPCRRRIVLPGFLPAERLPTLYNGADLFVFPSLYEGFGLPILEAMACGVPVACSNVSSLPEVAGDAAPLFDPLDESSIAETMAPLLTDSACRSHWSHRAVERAAQFTWQRTAQSTLAVLQEAAGCQS